MNVSSEHQLKIAASLEDVGADGDHLNSSNWLRSWFIAALLLAVVFLVANFKLVNGRAAPIWDAESFFAPAFTLIADHARAGQIALWNPWESGGSPDHAEPELGALSPVTIFVGAITGGTEAGFRAYWLLIWFLGPLGILLLARHFGAPIWAGFIIALGFAFSGFYTGHAEHTSSLYSVSFFPWILWRFDSALTSCRIRPAAEAGGLWGLSALGGYPQLTILSYGFLFLWALGRFFCTSSGEPTATKATPALGPGPRFSSAVLALVLVLAVGVAVLAPSYIAFFSDGGSGYSDRVGVRSREESVGSNTIEAGALATFASPYLTTLKFAANPKLWPTSDIALTNVYLGPIITVFALVAIVNRPRSAWRWWILVVAVFFLACAVGKQLPLRGWLYDYIPPTRYFRNSALFRAYTMFCAALLAILAAKDLQAVIKNTGARIWKHLLFAGGFVAIGALISYRYVIQEVEAKNVANRLGTANEHVVGVWIGFVALALLFLFQTRSRKMLPILLGILAIVDASLTIRLAAPTVYSSTYSRQSWTRINANHNLSLDLTPSGLKRDLRPPAWLGGYHNNENVPMRIATFFNYATMTNRFQENFAEHSVLSDMSTGTERIWFSRESATVDPNDAAYAAFVKRSEALAAPVMVVHPPVEMPQIRRRGLTGQADSEEMNAISNLPAAERVPFEVIRYTPNYLDLRVSTPDDGWLLVTDRWSHGWRANVNGHSTPVFGGDFIFRAVRVRAGTNTVEFNYHPAGWPFLLVMSYGTLAVVFVGLNMLPKQMWSALSKPRA